MRIVVMALTIMTCFFFQSYSLFAAKEDSVVVYTARKKQLVEPVFDRFTKETGIKVSYTTGEEAPLMERLASEGKNSPADVFITVDAGNLWQAAERDLLQPIDSKELASAIPSHLRDPQNRWYGLSVRARTIAYSTKRVKPEELTNYEALADAKWKGKLCLRTSKKVYNQSLVAMMIAEHGEKKTEEVVKGWVANLAAPVFASDIDVIKAIDAGQCDVGIVNSYYYGRQLKEQPNLTVKLFWPDSKHGGTHVNISGGGITKYAKHPEAAKKLLEWLSKNEAQAIFAEQNMEFPANPKAPVSKEISSWGKFDASLINVAQAGKLQKDAIKLMDRAGYK